MIEKILTMLELSCFDGLSVERRRNGVRWGIFITRGRPIKYLCRQGDGSEIRFESFDSREEKIRFFKKYGSLEKMFGKFPEVMEFSKNHTKEGTK